MKLKFLAVYLLSFGPVLGWYGAGPGTTWGPLPDHVRAFYAPLHSAHLPDGLDEWYFAYLVWCMDADRLLPPR